MKNVITLIENNLRMNILKRPTNFIIQTILPIIIVLAASKIFYYSQGSIDIGIIDGDNTKTSQILIENIKETDEVNIINTSNEKSEEQLVQRDIDFLVSIPKGYENSLLSESNDQIAIKTYQNDELYSLVSNSLEFEINNMKTLASISGDIDEYHRLVEDYSSNETNVNKNRLSDLSSDYENYRIFISFLMMMMFFRAISVAYNINTDKYYNVYTRMFISNTKTYQYYLANIISNLISLGIQISISMLALKYGLDIQIGMEYSHLFIILMLTSLVAVSFSSLCIAITKDGSEASMVSNIFSMLFIFCGGGMTSIEMLPEFMQKISVFTPIRWAMDSINDLQQGYGIGDISKNLIILVLFAVLFFVITAYKTSKDDKKFNIYG